MAAPSAGGVCVAGSKSSSGCQTAHRTLSWVKTTWHRWACSRTQRASVLLAPPGRRWPTRRWAAGVSSVNATTNATGLWSTSSVRGTQGGEGAAVQAATTRAIRSDLSAPRLLEAYGRGIFPYYDETTPILWWSPNPRAIIPLDGLRVSRRLARTVRSGAFTVSLNQAFVSVMEGCADREEGTWITEEM